MQDVQLDRIISQAKRDATRDGKPYAVFNLNKSGSRLLVIRDADSFAGENRIVAGPFQPEANANG